MTTEKKIPIPAFASVLLGIAIVAGFTPMGALWFESSMSTHMLIQIPLLIALGAISFQPGTRLNAFLTRLDPSGAVAFITLSSWMLFWMLPLNLDQATFDAFTRLLKLLSIPLGIGWCFRWFWRQANPVFKCVMVFETWAAVTRLGWLYIESPIQLCSSYLIGEQQYVGLRLLQISGIVGVSLVLYCLFGSFTKNNAPKLVNSSNSG